MQPNEASAIAASIISFVCTVATSNTIQASEPPRGSGVEFFCGTSKEGKPTTSARTSQGTFPIITWSKPFYPESNEDPLTRCVRVSGIIQTSYKQGGLDYITTGEMNGKYVICAASRVGSRCSRLLYILDPEENPDMEVNALREVLRRPSDSENIRSRLLAPDDRGAPGKRAGGAQR